MLIQLDTTSLSLTSMVYPKINLVLYSAALAICFSCTDNSFQNQTPEKDISSITQAEGRYFVDHNIILENKNLEPLLSTLRKVNLEERNRVDSIPAFIKNFLASQTDDNFSMANKGERWQVGCVRMGTPVEKKVYDPETKDSITEIVFDASKPLPNRELLYFGLGKNIALMAYYTGGIGKSEHILIIEFDQETITDFWCGNILMDVFTQKEILEYIELHKNEEWGLNTNIIYL